MAKKKKMSASYNLFTSHKNAKTVNTDLIKDQKIAATNSLLKAFFMQNKTIISIPVYHISDNRIIVEFFYYTGLINNSTDTTYFNQKMLISLNVAITQQWNNSDVSVELHIVRQYLPYLNASILSQYLAINASKYGANRIASILIQIVPYVNPDLSENQDFIKNPETREKSNKIVLPACTTRSKNSTFRVAYYPTKSCT
jgi:hypothetical protein